MKYIDLGLSVLWADCNIGANTPEEFGDYYKWDKIPKEYEIPTKEQQIELRDNCTWEWTTLNGEKGYKVISKKNGNSIFLPAAGFIFGNNLEEAGSSGCYWSSSPNDSYSIYAYYLYFDSNDVVWNYSYRIFGQSVRPIKSKTNFKNKTTMMTLKEVNEIFPLKSGMCLELFRNNTRTTLILFQYGDGEMCYIKYNTTNFGSLKYMYADSAYDLIKIYQSPTVCTIFDETDLIFNSDDYKIKEITLQEIADKFNVKVKNLRIKE